MNAEENNTGMLGAMDGMFPNEESIYCALRKGIGCSLKSFFVLKVDVNKACSIKGSSILPIPTKS